MSADTGFTERLRGRWDIGMLAVVVALAFGLLAAVAPRGFTRPVGFVASPLPTGTPMPSPTGGWWDRVSMTPPAPGALPGIPSVASLDAAGGGPPAGQAVPFSIVACPEPAVRIARIVTGKAGWWNVYGTAAAANLEYWKVELSADSFDSAQDGGQGWTLLYRQNAGVQDGLLMEFNTRTVPAGAYQLRLLAVDRTGNYGAPCTVSITTG